MKPAIRIAGQMIVYYVIMILMGFLFLMPIGQTYWLLAALSGLLLVAYVWMMYTDGATRGERAATLSVQLDRQREEGRAVAPEQAAERYNPSTAWKGYVFGVLPFVLIAIANIAMEPLYPPYVPATDEELAAIEQAAQQAEVAALMPEIEAIEQAENPDASPMPIVTPAPTEAEQESRRVNPFNIAARLTFLPYQAMYKPLEHRAVLLNWLMLVCALLFPLAEPVGYLQGPRLRQKKLEMIEKGKKRKMRNLRVTKQPKKRQPPKMEV